jgi:hypothetical protein
MNTHTKHPTVSDHALAQIDAAMRALQSTPKA